MPKYLLFTLLLLLISVSLQFIYVNENNTNSFPDGSKENPYPTIEDAINNFTPNDTDIVLLGDSVALTELITFPEGVVCTIRPDVIPESQYFPFNLGPGSGLIAYGSNFTLQNLQIIERDPNRDPMSNAFQMIKGTITFNRTYIADILYGASSYMLLYGGDNRIFEAAVMIFDSHFENLNNVQIFVQQTQVIIRNSSFDKIEINVGGFITLFQNSFVEANLTVIDTNITNSRFDYGPTSYFSGFIQLSNCTVDIYFNGLFVKNVTLTNGVPLVWTVAYDEDVNNPTQITILNTVVEDVFEVPDSQVIEQNVGIGLIFDLSAATMLNLTNFTANNVQFEYDSMMRWSADKSNFNYLWYLLPAITISNVKISNSAGANFLIFDIDSGLVENIELKNLSCISVDVKAKLVILRP